MNNSEIINEYLKGGKSFVEFLKTKKKFLYFVSFFSVFFYLLELDFFIKFLNYFSSFDFNEIKNYADFHLVIIVLNLLTCWYFYFKNIDIDSGVISCNKRISNFKFLFITEIKFGNENKYEEIKNKINIYINYFKKFWLFMSFTYIFILFEKLNNKYDQINLEIRFFKIESVSTVNHNHFFSILQILTNNISTIYILLIVLHISDVQNISKKRNYLFLTALFFFLSQILFVILSGIIGVEVKEIGIFFQYITGLFAGGAIALLVGRMDSKLFNIPPLNLYCLYFYAILQFVFKDLQDAEIFIAKLFSMTFFLLFVLKIYFFYLVEWSFNTGRIHFYFQVFPDFNSAINNSYIMQKNELKIREGQKLNIFNGTIYAESKYTLSLIKFPNYGTLHINNKSNFYLNIYFSEFNFIENKNYLNVPSKNDLIMDFKKIKKEGNCIIIHKNTYHPVEIEIFVSNI